MDEHIVGIPPGDDVQFAQITGHLSPLRQAEPFHRFPEKGPEFFLLPIQFPFRKGPVFPVQAPLNGHFPAARCKKRQNRQGGGIPQAPSRKIRPPAKRNSAPASFIR